MDILNRPAIKFEAKSLISIDLRWFIMFFAGIVPILYDGFRMFIHVKSSNSIWGYEELLTANPYITNFSLLIPIISLLVAPIVIAISGYYVNCLRTKEFSPGYVYQLAAVNYIKFIITTLIKRIFLFFWTILFVIPGIIKFYSYSMTEYIICDNPSMDPADAISLSRKITHGYKWDIFVMQLSFFPWILLVALTAGIATIYVTPYIRTTTAMYYENLKRNAIEKNIASPAEFGIF